MDRTKDELAGVVDLFGALTREELERALGELAFKRGEDVEAVAVEAALADARDTYHLVVVDRDGEELVVPGPAAFPSLPENAADLPHIMDVPDREVPDDACARRVEERLRRDAAEAVADGDDDRVARLLDVTYDAEAWAPVDLGDLRDRLDG